jgi:hypothetical protein
MYKSQNEVSLESHNFTKTHEELAKTFSFAVARVQLEQSYYSFLIFDLDRNISLDLADNGVLALGERLLGLPNEERSINKTAEI